MNKLRHKNSLKKLIHRKILTFTLQNCLLYHKIKIVMVTNNNDTIQHVAKVITQLEIQQICIIFM
jgi:2-C-methyl-D-erythritol 4-phosphate cytidylyltransferase